MSTATVLQFEAPCPDTVVLTIDRPERLNAIDFAVMAALERALDALEQAPPAVLVIASSGSRAFVSGGDLEAFRALDTAAHARDMASRMCAILERLERLPSLVTAAVVGAAFGGGCELLLACDRVIAHPEATLGFTQARFALTPGWGGATRLVERVGRRRALLLLAEARILDARAALELGLVDSIAADPLAEARASVARLACTERGLLGALKRVTTAAGTSERAERFAAEREIFVERWVSPQHHERVEAFFARKG